MGLIFLVKISKALKSVVFDAIKILLKKRMRGEEGKKKETDLDVFL